MAKKSKVKNASKPPQPGAGAAASQPTSDVQMFFTSSATYELRLAAGITLTTEVPLDTEEIEAGTKYKKGTLKKSKAAKFLFAHVDHNRHIIYLINVHDDLEKMTTDPVV